MSSQDNILFLLSRFNLFIVYLFLTISYWSDINVRLKRLKAGFCRWPRNSHRSHSLFDSAFTAMSTSTVAKYNEDLLPEYTPLSWYVVFKTNVFPWYPLLSWRSWKEIRAAIPPRFFIRDTRRGLLYFARDLILAAIFWTLATFIDPCFKAAATKEILTPIGAEVSRWAAWCI